MGSTHTKKTQEPRAEAALQALDAKAAGTMLIYHLLVSHENRFCVSNEEFVRLEEELPVANRNDFQVLALFYLAWRMRIIAGQLYGKSFQIDMMTFAFSTIEKSGIPDAHIPSGEIRKSFAILDSIYMDYSLEYNGIAIPFSYMAAIGLLNGPERLEKGNALVTGEMELALAFGHLEDQTAETTPALLKASAEGTR